MIHVLCFLSVLLCDCLLMVRMRPCAEGALAPHWLPLCSCYCCHCSCAVSGQSRKASSPSLMNAPLPSDTESNRFWLSCLVLLFSLLCFPTLISSPVFFKYLLCSMTSCFFYIVFPHLSSSPVTRSYYTTVWLHLPVSLSLLNIFPISPDFELRTMLFVSFLIYHYLSWDTETPLPLVTLDVPRHQQKQITHLSFASTYSCVSLNVSQLGFLLNLLKSFEICFHRGTRTDEVWS